jgi:hypothetical protein
MATKSVACWSNKFFPDNNNNDDDDDDANNNNYPLTHLYLQVIATNSEQSSQILLSYCIDFSPLDIIIIIIIIIVFIALSFCSVRLCCQCGG